MFNFHFLLHDYRKRQQFTDELEWSDARQHLNHWQEYVHLYQTFHNAWKLATNPIVGLRLWRATPKRARILEYGCSLAPYYYCYRRFFSHLGCKFVLADIPNYPFHYAKYLYRDDEQVEFITINAEDFSDPLAGLAQDQFDVVILTTVYEHLDDPLFVTEYLLSRLKPGGLFVFDYIKSHGHGLDHPRALDDREAALRSILQQTAVIHGDVDISDDVGWCMARKLAD